MRSKKRFSMVAALALLLTAACGGGDSSGSNESNAKTSSATQSSASSVKATGRVIEIKMISDEKGERYDPVEIEAHRGDVVRFVLVSGVHNTSFPADKNPAGVKLPSASEYLQMSGQKLDFVVDWPVGKYYYQCDAHVLMGMIGYIEVEEEGA